MECPAERRERGKLPARTELKVTGMTCNNCVRHVTDAIQAVPGVSSALVTLENERAVVRWGGEPNIPAVIKAIEGAGYKAEVKQAEGHQHAHGGTKATNWHWNLWIGVLGTLPLMLGEWVFGLASEPWFRFVSLILATVVQVGAGAPFYRGAWNQLKVGSSNMDTLVALGSTTAYVFSAWIFITGAPGHLYFMEAAAIITIISVGHWLEARMGARASGSLRKLMQLAPEMARVREPNGTERDVPVAELDIDAVVVLKPGDRVPTDGEVLEGASAVDESMLTGESNPADKTVKDLLYAGTVNLNGRLVMRVTAVGEETALSHIISAVQRAQTSRANIQRLGDRVSSIFVPIVVCIALAAGLWWALAPEQALAVHQWLASLIGDWWPVHAPAGVITAAVITAASVLIVACPCAMGLATPAAIMAGSNAAAERGILIRDGVALEKAGRVTAVLFDKTGTLTVGKPAVAHSETWSGAAGWKPGNQGPMVDLAAALGRPSNHPLSRAVAQMASAGVNIDNWQEVHGAGVQGEWRDAVGDLKVVRLGSLKWLIESGVDLSPNNPFAAQWAEQGATILGLSADDTLLGLFALKDSMKAGAQKVVEQIRRQGLKVYLVTGDNPRTAASIARQAGIQPENIFAEVRPEQKAEFVKKLQGQGQRVAFIGDGINDAPALEQADLGIAVSRASDIAREAADIILLNSEIEAVPESLALARATLRTIKQNLFWAFFYNAVAIPFAALGLMSPVLCAAAMGLSDVVVIGNALRLRFR